AATKLWFTSPRLRNLSIQRKCRGQHQGHEFNFQQVSWDFSSRFVRDGLGLALLRDQQHSLPLGRAELRVNCLLLLFSSKSDDQRISLGRDSKSCVDFTPVVLCKSLSSFGICFVNGKFNSCTRHRDFLSWCY